MADKKISQLVEHIDIENLDVIPIVNSNETKKIKFENLSAPLQLRSEKNQGNGYAGLDVSAKVGLAYLPDFAFFLKYADFASLPVLGFERNIYLTLDDNKLFYWDGAGYVEMSIGGATPTFSEVLTAGNSMGATQQIQSSGGLSLLQLRDAYIFLQIGTSLLNLSEFINIINNSNNSFIQSSTGGTLITRQDPLYTIKKTELFINPDDIGITSHTVLNQNYINIVLDALTGSFKYKKYVSNILTQEIDLLSSATQTTTDEYFTSSVVTGAIGSTGASVTFTELKQIPLVFINGLKVRVGFNATPSNNLCFFSPNGSTVRANLGAIVSGDLLYWNPLYTNSFDLAVTDEINLVYNKI